MTDIHVSCNMINFLLLLWPRAGDIIGDMGAAGQGWVHVCRSRVPTRGYQHRCLVSLVVTCQEDVSVADSGLILISIMFIVSYSYANLSEYSNTVTILMLHNQKYFI